MALFAPIAVVVVGAHGRARSALGEDRAAAARRRSTRSGDPAAQGREAGWPSGARPYRRRTMQDRELDDRGVRLGPASVQSRSSSADRRDDRAPCSCAEGSPTRRLQPLSSRPSLPGHDPLPARRHGGGCRTDPGPRSPAGERICVHGDYDVDGICATAVMVLALRELGADVSWHLPSRFEEGYGLARETVERLAADGVGLIVTVDCGITAVDEVAHARELGLDVIVTDHHRPGDALPDCPVVATRPSEYPFPDLCGTGVALQACRGAPRRRASRCSPDTSTSSRLATIADVVPLVDENRALAVAGSPRSSRARDAPGSRADASRAGRPGDDRRERGRLPARPADQRRRTARTAPTSRSSCSSPTTADEPTSSPASSKG